MFCLTVVFLTLREDIKPFVGAYEDGGVKYIRQLCLHVDSVNLGKGAKFDSPVIIMEPQTECAGLLVLTTGLKYVF